MFWLETNADQQLVCSAADDVWMHAKGVPGSHLIIRIPSGREATKDDLQYAADLSAYFSKARESGRCDVIIATGKDIKKPRGAKPGQVMIVEGRETVWRGFPGNSAAAVAERSSK